MDIYVGVYVDVNLLSWDMHTANLNIEVGYPRSVGHNWAWSMTVLNYTRISTVHGGISMADWDSPTIHSETVGGNNEGILALRDEVRLKSETGNISVAVAQEARRTQWAGPEKSQVYSQLVSDNSHGDTELNVFQRRWRSGKGDIIESHHHSQSGSILVRLLERWSGMVEGESTEGTIKLSGGNWTSHPDATEKQSSATRHVQARMGVGTSHTRAKTTTGEIEFHGITDDDWDKLD